MGRFIIRRVLLMIPVILGVLIIVFAVSRMSGDPVIAILGAEATEEQYQAERERLGLDKSLPMQFLIYVKQIVTKFDLGTSYISRQPVGKEILRRLPISVGLALIGLSVALVIGVTFGVLCAVNQNSKIDYIITILALICCSLPGFWVALMLIIVVSVRFGLLPPSGLDTWKHWILPCTSIPIQFLNYLKQIVTKFDLGTSYITRQPVGKEILRRLPVSAGLAVIGLTAALIVGVIFGVLCAINQNRTVDYVITLFALICCSLPSFWVALILIIIISVRFGLLPPSGLDSWRHWILPCVSMALSPLATMSRTTRSSMLEVLRQDYVCTAQSKGISRARVILKHALKNAIFPIITVFGPMAAAMIGGAVVMETVFQIAGVGSYLSNAIFNRDFPVIQGTVFVLSLMVCVVNLLVDIAYGFADPRIRAKYSASNSGHRRKKKAKANTTARGAA